MRYSAGMSWNSTMPHSHRRSAITSGDLPASRGPLSRGDPLSAGAIYCWHVATATVSRGGRFERLVLSDLEDSFYLFTVRKNRRSLLGERCNVLGDQGKTESSCSQSTWSTSRWTGWMRTFTNTQTNGAPYCISVYLLYINSGKMTIDTVYYSSKKYRLWVKT